MPEKLWFCGQHVGESWEFQGIFSTREKAIGACRTIKYFIAPVNLDEELPKETTLFKDLEYPLLDLIKIEFALVKED